jgi:YegS/Rv2252/BmrU family lipid kinase
LLLALHQGLSYACATVRICVIFNPAAKGDKARRFRRHLDEIGAQCGLKLTSAPGDARRLAAEAVTEKYEVVVAAGGDGTVNEVLNGIADEPEGFLRVTLGVLPLGTVNVFARELGLPQKLESAWEVIRSGKQRRIDLPSVEYGGEQSRQKRYFVQLGGAGLDARAIELVNWELKRRTGPLAYVWAGLHAMLDKPPEITADGGARQVTGGLVLIGNGRLYGGSYRIFPKAELQDGLLDVCVFPRVNWWTLTRCGPPLLINGKLPSGVVESFQAERLTLSSKMAVPLEVDGELIGHLPATFRVEQGRLRVVAT